MPQCPGSAGCCVCRGSQSALIPLFPDPEKDVTPQDNLLSIRDGSKTTQTEDKACTSPTPMYKVCNTNISPFLLIFCTLRNSQKVWDTVSADRLCTLTDSVLPFISPVIHLNNTCCINFLNLAYDQLPSSSRFSTSPLIPRDRSVRVRVPRTVCLRFVSHVIFHTKSFRVLFFVALF